MARPLTKRKDGSLYTRPKRVEEQLDEALELPLPDLRLRLRVRSDANPAYLCSETLVHLMREALRSDRQLEFEAAFRVLIGRCERLLKARIPDAELRNAEAIRDEVLSQLSELFVRDKLEAEFDRLDYYECRFNAAFRRLYLTLLRRQRKREERETVPAATSDDGTPTSVDDVLDALAYAHQKREGPPDPRLHRAIQLANRLPHNERQAFVLCTLLRFKQSSKDPNETTAASLIGVSDRTIRSRLKNAEQRLQRMLEET